MVAEVEDNHGGGQGLAFASRFVIARPPRGSGPRVAMRHSGQSRCFFNSASYRFFFFFIREDLRCLLIYFRVTLSSSQYPDCG